jgi:hypothetical protein
VYRTALEQEGETRMDKLFSASTPSDSDLDPLYVAVRDKEPYADVCSYLQALWERYEAYADPDFLTKIPHEFHQRYWEMRLGCTLLDLGFVLQPSKGKGPDFDACTPAGKRVYIEAVTKGPGKEPDAVPRPNFGSGGMEPEPWDQIVLRIRAAISEKSCQHASHVNSGIIDPAVPYVIAVNIGNIPGASVSDAPPTITRACLGINSLRVVFTPDRTSEVFLTQCDAIFKASKSPVDTRIFWDSEYSWLSGMLLSDVNAFRVPPGTFQFLHNPGAEQPVDRGWLPIGSEHWVEGDRICNHYWPEVAGV